MADTSNELNTELELADAESSTPPGKPPKKVGKESDSPKETESKDADEDDDLLDETLPVPTGEEAKAILEALLFSATSPLSVRRLTRLLNGIDVQALSQVIEDLRSDYDRAHRGITIMEVAGGFQLATRQIYAEWVYRLHSHRKRSGITPAVLETLAIVAYKQPIVRADVEAIRGVDCGGILRQLQDTGLVEVVGRKEVVGRPPLYGTTDLFLKAFGLRRLSDLPSMEELQALMAESVDSGPESRSAASEEAPAVETAETAELPFETTETSDDVSEDAVVEADAPPDSETPVDLPETEGEETSLTRDSFAESDTDPREMS